MLAGEMMTAISDVIKPRMAEEGAAEKLGKVVIGTVRGDKFTIGGNVSASVMSTGSTEALRAECDALVELYEDAPGYIMSFGCGFEMTTDEKIRAYRDSVKK